MYQFFDTYLKEELKKGFIEECLIDSEDTNDDQKLAEILRRMRNARHYSIQELFENYPIQENAMGIVLSAVCKYYGLAPKETEHQKKSRQ
jgi:hypothetical protein